MNSWKLSILVIVAMKETFPRRLISNRGDAPWLDLAKLEQFLLVGSQDLKSLVDKVRHRGHKKPRRIIFLMRQTTYKISGNALNKLTEASEIGYKSILPKRAHLGLYAKPLSFKLTMQESITLNMSEFIVSFIILSYWSSKLLCRVLYIIKLTVYPNESCTFAYCYKDDCNSSSINVHQS